VDIFVTSSTRRKVEVITERQIHRRSIYRWLVPGLMASGRGDISQRDAIIATRFDAGS
jgi:hypothetical protein